MLMLHKLPCEGTNKDITTTTNVTVLGTIVVRTTVSDGYDHILSMTETSLM